MAKRTTRLRRRKGSGTIISRNGWLAIRWHEDGQVCQESIGLRDTAINRAEASDILEKRTGFAKLLTQKQRLQLLIQEHEEVEKKIARLKSIVVGRTSGKLDCIVEAFRKSPYRKDTSPAQLSLYCQRISDFVEWAGPHTALTAVNDTMAADYAGVLSAKYSGASFNKHIAALRICWVAVAKSLGLESNPWESIARKRNESHTRRALTDDEVAKILAKAQGEMRDLILIGLHTGMRLGDCARLKWENFLGDGYVQVKTAKTGALVAIPSKRLLDALGRQGKSGYVVPTIAEKVAKKHGM